MKLNAANERIKHRYFAHQRGPMQLDDQSVDAIAAALDRFEEHTGRRDFKSFRSEQADAFQRALLKQKNARTGQPLTKGTIVSILRHLKAFFFWLADQPAYKSMVEVARTRREPRVPTLDQIHATIAAMPISTPIDLRNRALVAFTILTGSRDGATASLRLRHVNIGERMVCLDGRDVNTKFAKTINAAFFPVGGDAETILRGWIAFLTGELGFGPDDPLFPATRTGFGSDGLPVTPTLSRECWSSADPIRSIFKAAFAGASLQYFNPHSFRHALARLGTATCQDAEELKVWSQNLGHVDVLTTLTSYGEVPFHRQRNLILAMADRDEDTTELIRLGRAVRAATAVR